MWINRVNTAATPHAQVGQARRSERVSHNHYRPSKCHRTTLIQSLILRHDAAGITFLHLVSGGMGLKHHDSGDTVSLSPAAWRSLGGNRILILARSAEKLFSGWLLLSHHHNFLFVLSPLSRCLWRYRPTDSPAHCRPRNLPSPACHPNLQTDTRSLRETKKKTA